MRIDQESNTFPAELSVLILFKMIESIDMILCVISFLVYIMSVISNYNCMQKDFLGHGGGGGTHPKNIFLFPISLIGEMVFSTNIYKLVLAQREKHFQG